ncbi:MAG: hypothetical protein KGD66_02215 [Candidatus Lokiarchaeota archaeon]|nr:hypothetical protein [Candidatus Lokiarchaeota archaeon]
MVFKNIQRIKKAMPEVLHIVMYYNNGTVYQTSFDSNMNIPKIGENLAESIAHIKILYDLCNFTYKEFTKLIFETDEISTIILKLGEDSNIALFFKKEDDTDLKLTAIKRYLSRIESLVDMDEKELLLQDILLKEEELKNMKMNLQSKQEILSENLILIDKINRGDEVGDVETLTKNTQSLQDEINKINVEIENLTNDITSFRGKIEGAS